MKFRVLIALLAIALIAAACGSDLNAEPTVSGEAPSESDEAMEDEESDEAMEDEAIEDEESDDAMDDEESGAAEADAGGDAGPDANAAAAIEAGEQRIVSLSPTSTEMLFAVGAGDLVVAVDEFSNFPAEAPITDLSGFTPNVEAIAAFEPTTVYSSFPVEGLDAIGIENVVLSSAVVIDDVYAQIEQVGAATGNVAEATELVLQMQTSIDAILADLPERETPLTYYHELDTTFFSATSSTFIGQVYSLLGLENVADAADPDGEAFGFPQLSEEFIIEADPDIIFLADTIFESQTADTVAARPGWDQLSAVQNGNVVEMNDDISSRWGPRIVEFLEVAGAAVAEIEAVPAG